MYNNLIASFSQHSVSVYPLECCGIITKNLEYIPCNNISPKPKTSFILDPMDLIPYDNNIWGIFHSHPSQDWAIPSEKDFEQAIVKNIKYITGFSGRYFIYWKDKEIMIYEKFEEHHLEGALST